MAASSARPARNTRFFNPIDFLYGESPCPRPEHPTVIAAACHRFVLKFRLAKMNKGNVIAGSFVGRTFVQFESGGWRWDEKSW
jgi:hypothetical protein